MSRWDEYVGPGRARVAGRWNTWGNTITVPAGATLAVTELVRASVDVPIVWWTHLFASGPGGAVAEFFVAPGLGKVQTNTPVKAVLAGNEQVVQMPARELVISVQVPVAPIGGSLVIVALAAPLAWPAGLTTGWGLPPGQDS